MTPEFNSRLIAPCWGPYSDEAEDKAELDGAAAYGGKYREDLGQVSGKAGFGADYGTRGHTVDVPLVVSHLRVNCHSLPALHAIFKRVLGI